MSAGSGAKMALGGVLIASGILILSGADKALEASLVSVMPAWLTDLTTRF
jgi:cytochrome c-type biogenesis protein